MLRILLALVLSVAPALASQQPVFRGTTPNDNSGDAPYAAFGKLNANDAELYASVGTLTTALAGKAAAVHTHVISDVTGLQSALDAKLAITAAAASYAPLISPALTGTPTVPTAAPGTNTTQAASTSFVAAALGSYLTSALAATNYAPLASPALSGTPTAPTAPVGTATTQIATMAAIANAIAASPGGATIPAGQIRLAYTSTTSLTAKPFGGNQLWVSGGFRTVPSAGFTCSNTGTTAGTLTYAYAYWTGTALACEVSTTAHAADATYGHEIKSGDGSRTLIGMAYMDAGTPGTFADAATKRWVASWFNRSGRAMAAALTGPASSSNSAVDLTPSNRITFVSWADEIAQASAVGYTSNRGASYCGSMLSFDGSVSSPTQYGYSASGGVQVPLGIPFGTALSEGYHYATLQGSAASNTCTWNVTLTGSVR